jgi:hypothetical protein
MLLLGVGFTHLIDRTELVNGETSVTIFHSSYKSRDRGSNGTGTERVREREKKRTIVAGQNKR